MTGGLFTWSNNKKPTLEKLDRVLVSRSWENLFPLAMVHKISRNNSDHNPLIIKLNNEHANPIKEFRH
jgi:endonuclease/exonuclease/phosphatase family metal-dependent hydrolase